MQQVCLINESWCFRARGRGRRRAEYEDEDGDKMESLAVGADKPKHHKETGQDADMDLSEDEFFGGGIG